MEPILQILALSSDLLKPLGASERRHTILVGFQFDLVLREYRKYYYQMAKEYGRKWNVFADAVFFTKGDNAGKCITPNAMSMWFRDFLKNNNLPHYHPNQFRHTAISLQLQAGISVPDVAKRAGHSRSDVTLLVYGHILRNNDKHCCEAVTKVLPKLPKREIS